MVGENRARVSDPDVRLVKVEHAEGTAYRQLHGQFSWMTEDKARAGAEKGLWKICEEEPAR